MKRGGTPILMLCAGLCGPAYSEVVLDTDDDVATLSGTWTQSKAVPGFYGSDFATAVVGGGADTARFFSQRTITTSGPWCVQARWTAGANRSGGAQYQVFDGSTLRGTVSVNQKVNGGAWRRLGCFQFTAGKTGEVRLLDSGAAGELVVADGVRWVWDESARPVCVNVAGGFGAGGVTFVGQGFTMPGNGACTPWSGTLRTATTVVGTSSGTGCVSSDGKVLTLALQSLDPPFFGPGTTVTDYIQVCPGGAAGCPVAQTDQGSFFTGAAALTSCTPTLLQIPSVHD